MSNLTLIITDTPKLLFPAFKPSISAATNGKASHAKHTATASTFYPPVQSPSSNTTTTTSPSTPSTPPIAFGGLASTNKPHHNSGHDTHKSKQKSSSYR
jgi:hypothetical protein